jgi:hypothetical protein
MRLSLIFHSDRIEFALTKMTEGELSLETDIHFELFVL